MVVFYLYQSRHCEEASPKSSPKERTLNSFYPLLWRGQGEAKEFASYLAMTRGALVVN